MITTSIIILLAIVGPIVYFNGMKVRGERKMLKMLQHLAGANNSNIDEYDVWGAVAIGVDKTSKKLFYITSDVKKDIVIDLSFVKRSREIETRSKSKIWVEQLELVFELGNSQADVSLLFYSAQNNNFSISNENELLHKWQELANSLIG